SPAVPPPVVRRRPFLLQGFLQPAVPHGILRSVMAAGTVAVTERGFIVFEIRGAGGRDVFFASRLFHRVGNVLVQLRRVAAKVLLCLLPIPAERLLDLVPVGVIVLGPPRSVIAITSHGSFLLNSSCHMRLKCQRLWTLLLRRGKAHPGKASI